MLKRIKKRIDKTEQMSKCMHDTQNGVIQHSFSGIACTTLQYSPVDLWMDELTVRFSIRPSRNVRMFNVKILLKGNKLLSGEIDSSESRAKSAIAKTTTAAAAATSVASTTTTTTAEATATAVTASAISSATSTTTISSSVSARRVVTASRIAAVVCHCLSPCFSLRKQ
jgi:hypothetical protein